MRALWKKELQNLFPLLPLFSLFLCGDLIVVPLTRAFDQVSWFSMRSSLLTGESSSYLLYIMGLVAAYSLFPREYEELTIEFLHTLPVTRTQIFGAKFGAAATILVVACLLQELTYAGLALGDVNSLTSQQFSLATSAKLLLLNSVTALLGLAHGLLFSFGRQFGLLMLGFVFWGISELSSHHPPLAAFDPMELADPIFYGHELLMPWKLLAWHLLAGLLFLGVAHRLWSTRGHQGTEITVTKANRWKKSVGCFTMLAVVVLFILWIASEGSEEGSSEDEGPVSFPSYQTARLATAHYNFTFPVNLRGRALRLSLAADGIFTDASSQLGCREEEKGLVIADLTDFSSEHLGIASTEKLRIDITSNQEHELLEHVLHHETCHVLCRRLAGARGREYSHVLGFFSEGTAEFFAFAKRNSSRSRRDARRQAVAMYSRHDIRLRELLDSKECSRRFGDELSYTLGEIWAQALVDCYGTEAPGKVWRAIGRPDGPKLEEAHTFWQDTLQAAGYSYERVRSRWLVRLNQLEDEESEFLGKLPRISGGAEVHPDGYIIVQGQCDRPWAEEFEEVVVRIRTPNSNNTRRLRVGFDQGVVLAHVPDSYGGTFDYQFGVRFSESSYPYWEEWKSAKGL